MQIGQHRPLNYAVADTGLPIMRADEGDLARAVEKAWSLLLASNRTPWLFRYAGIPTWVVPDDEGRPVAATLTEERLRHMLARLADWRRHERQGRARPRAAADRRGEVGARHPRSRRCRCSSAS